MVRLLHAFANGTLLQCRIAGFHAGPGVSGNRLIEPGTGGSGLTTTRKKDSPGKEKLQFWPGLQNAPSPHIPVHMHQSH